MSSYVKVLQVLFKVCFLMTWAFYLPCKIYPFIAVFIFLETRIIKTYIDWKKITMAGVIASDIKDLITINIKHRHDDLSDQYNRVFMVKLCLVSSLIMSVSWFKDSIKCIVPGRCLIIASKWTKSFLFELKWLEKKQILEFIFDFFNGGYYSVISIFLLEYLL